MAQERHRVFQPYGLPYRCIALTQGQTAIVDLEDFEKISSMGLWIAAWDSRTKSYYAARGEHRKKIYMHRVVLDCGVGEEADHKSHDTLDNRKENLRKVN